MTVAVLVRPRGNRGELTARFAFQQAGALRAAKKVRLFGDGEEFEVERVWEHQGTLVFKFAGVDSIGDAEKLRGAEVRVPRTERVPLDPGEYFQSDLDRLRSARSRFGSRDRRRHRTGKNTAARALLEIDGGRMLIPFVKAICADIRPDERLDPRRVFPKVSKILPAMKFHLLTIFPDFFDGPFRHGVVARGGAIRRLRIQIHDLRNWTHDLAPNRRRPAVRRRRGHAAETRADLQRGGNHLARARAGTAK